MKWTKWFNSASFTSGLLMTIGGLCLLIGWGIQDLYLIASGAVLGMIGLTIYMLLWLYIKINKIPPLKSSNCYRG